MHARVPPVRSVITGLVVSALLMTASFSASTLGACNPPPAAGPPVLIDLVVVEPHSATLTVGSTLTLTVQVHTPVPGTDTTVRWSSANPNVATVNQNGTVQALAPGQAWIRAIPLVSSKIADSASVTVIPR